MLCFRKMNQPRYITRRALILTMVPEADNNVDLVITGGGITGLSAAYIAAKEGKRVTVIESGSAFGGLLNTFVIGNNRLEYYYHHFFLHDAELLWLIKELHLEDKLSFKRTSMGVFSNGKVHNFNTAFDLLKFSPINFLDKIRFGITSIYLGNIAKWKRYENVPCMKWLNKWAGKSTTRSLWSPLLNVKFGPYAGEVPLSWMIGRLRQRMNSRKMGNEKLGYIDGSLQVLVDAMVQKLKELDVKLVNNATVEEICLEGPEVQFIRTAKGDFSGKDYLFTIPGINLGNLLEKKVPGLAASLLQIKYFGAICLILELNRPLSGIYWLNIADEGFPFGGVIEHTNFINPCDYNGSFIAYLSRYFSNEEAIGSMSDDEIKDLMLSYLPKIYPNFKTDWIKNIYIFKTATAATVCDMNFSKKVPKCKTIIRNLYVTNMSHVYPDERSVNNSIRIAAEACRVIGINTDFIPKKYSLSGKIGF